MNNYSFYYPLPANEPVLNYAPGSSERTALKQTLQQLQSATIQIPMYIGGKEVYTDTKFPICPPHRHQHILAYGSMGNESHVQQAIQASLAAREAWATMDWYHRAHIFLKAAELLATKYRWWINAATMLGQSKNAYQAEIDSACELIDFLRFNVYYLNEIYKQQPISAPGIRNSTEWRALEGFVVAITPFNFTAIAGNLPTSAALCGNVVVWKPATTQLYAAQVILLVLKEAGLPDGVINLVVASGEAVSNQCLSHKQFAGIHFTGSTGVFNTIWKTIGQHIGHYKTYPRIVGETGGKDFVMVHTSADADVAATALVRGAFEYQGQKCSAASRAYLPQSLSHSIIEKLKATLGTIQMGVVDDFTNFVNAVIDEKSFDKIVGYIEQAKASKDATIIAGGQYDKTEGYFIQPTVILTTNPQYTSLCEEIFGPVLTVYVYPDQLFSETLHLVNETSPYALTGSIIAQDRAAIIEAENSLRQAAGNFYINDKPTGAVVGQQPFGGARASGTNDKAGSMLNLYRWLSARSIKETLNPPTQYGYPFLQEA